MKYFRQFCIIIVISCLGELCHFWLPLPIPASIYGLLLMLAALCTRLIPLDSVKDAGKFLIDIMPVMFIPAAVGLLESWGVLRPMLIPLLVIVPVTTILVMVVSGRVTQWVIRKEKRRRK
ncbi:MAG TPA: CidA/LrgA family protein [Candidatus Scatomonas pullistercoris]|uniref:CidA/LrgA family protein n=1 Tax=Candidatus Scatomonas pullistercoris TaxID=2840920 RepID=A0A9D1P345_9FIRM|nr:CidA/LrgA family protein [Candidatus Scatomonas pullistercoris]